VAKKKKQERVGRPTDYTPEIADEICTRLVEGELLEEICRDEHMPHRKTVWRWKNREDVGKEFSHALIRAREEQQWTFKDRMLATSRDDSKDCTECVTERLDKAGNITAIVTEKKSDNTAVQRHRLQVDTLWRCMQSLNATVFGQKEKVELTGANGGAIKFAKVVDKPPKETPEEWQARVQKQLEDRAKKNSS
jgi:hypothetical protein